MFIVYNGSGANLQYRVSLEGGPYSTPRSVGAGGIDYIPLSLGSCDAIAEWPGQEFDAQTHSFEMTEYSYTWSVSAS